MLSPKRTKFRKAHKGRIHGLAKGGTALNFGQFGLKALEAGADHGAADRSGAACDYPVDEARWARLDPDFPGRSGVAEAG